MAENNEGVNRMMEKFALLADAMENIYPQGRGVVVFELNEDDFNLTQKEMLIPTNVSPQFKVDISGTEFIFLKRELLNDETDTI
jgi:hypothetical protein